MDNPALEAHDLVKTFPGGVVAVDGLDLEVPRGSVYGLLGRNGAGKTTTLRLLAGLLRPDHGVARVLGMDLWKAPSEDRARAAYVSQEQRIHAWMTLDELCSYASHFYARWDRDYALELARHFEISWGVQAGLMSGGEQRKAAILLALAGRPEVLILDEPAAGLDPIARRALVDRILDVISGSDGCTVLFSTHIVSDVERVAEHVGFMDRGRLVESLRLEDLQNSTKRVQVIFEGAVPEGFSIPGALRSQRDGPVVTAIARLPSEAALSEVRRIEGARVNVFPLGLEDLFIELFGGEEED